MKTMTVIGAGGVGSRIIPLAYREYELTVMDGDTFERKNMDRQIMGRSEIGMNKAKAMAKLYGAKAAPEYLTDPKQLEGAEFVVCVPDNHQCRLLAIIAADLYGFGLVLAGNEEYTANAMYYHAKYRDTSVDPRVMYPDILAGAEREIGETCLEKIDTKPQTGNANAMAASFALALAHYWTNELPDDEIIRQYAPFEFAWHNTFLTTKRGFKG